mgnify:CR=1 FL=1
MNQVKIFFGVIAVLFVGVVATALVRSNQVPSGPGQYDAFAQCLTEKGAVFYGAFWCPHCQAQKKMFGPSAKLLPYVECSALDGKTQTPICIEKNITSYPTWEFADGSRLSGEVSLETLAEKTSCELTIDTKADAAPVDAGASSPAQ